MKPQRQVVSMPTCGICGERVVANACGATPHTPEAVEAIQAVLLAVHKRLAHAGTDEDVWRAAYDADRAGRQADVAPGEPA